MTGWHPAAGVPADDSDDRRHANRMLWRTVQYDAAAQVMPPQAEADLIPSISAEWCRRQAESCRESAHAVLYQIYERNRQR